MPPWQPSYPQRARKIPAEERGLACSVSAIARSSSGRIAARPPLLQTFVDVEPISVGFAAHGEGVEGQVSP